MTGEHCFHHWPRARPMARQHCFRHWPRARPMAGQHCFHHSPMASANGRAGQHCSPLAKGSANGRAALLSTGIQWGNHSKIKELLVTLPPLLNASPCMTWNLVLLSILYPNSFSLLKMIKSTCIHYERECLPLHDMEPCSIVYFIP